MADERDVTGASFEGARFAASTFNGATFRGCDLRGVRVVDSWLMDVHLSGEIDRVVVNDVDVTEYVEGELERRHPERAQLRQMRTADDHRAMWDTLERLWSDAVERARRLPEGAVHERVDGEWSFAETLRHLAYATDAWAFRTVLDDPRPFAPIDLPQSDYPRDAAAAIGIDLDAEPTFDEIVQVRSERMAGVRRIVDELTESGLGRVCTRPPAPGYAKKERTVGECLAVVMTEECEHLRYARRDLEALERR